jgi:hypothetical protein
MVITIETVPAAKMRYPTAADWQFKPDGTLHVGAFGCMAAIHANLEKVQPAFKNGGGAAWGDQSTCLFCAVARFFRPGYQNHIVSEWLPALDGVVAKLERGGRVGDVGCGMVYPQY